MDRDTAREQLRQALLAHKSAQAWSKTARSTLQTVVFKVHAESGMSHTEIAEALGLHRNTVMNWCHEATAK